MVNFKKLKNYCRNEYVTRSQLNDLTGGIVTGSTMTKLDSIGVGIKNRKIIGGKTVYHIDDIIQWLEENTVCIKQ
jgi:phage terminase Nu1 subunit (DNA packaging protein)